MEKSIRIGILAMLGVGLMTVWAWAITPPNGKVFTDSARILSGTCKVIGGGQENLDFNTANGKWNCDDVGDLAVDTKVRVKIKVNVEGTIAPPDGKVNKDTARILSGSCKVKNGAQADLNFNNQNGRWNCDDVGVVDEGDKVTVKVKVKVVGEESNCSGGGCAFLTSTTHQGDFGGLSGGDAICNARASEAGLSGTFVAWLSTSTVDAKDRIPDQAYYRVDGVKVVDDKSDLIDGDLDARIDIDETGAMTPSGIPDRLVWTGTVGSGVGIGTNSCADWTDATTSSDGIQGVTTLATDFWAFATVTQCGLEARLYCFEE